MNIIRLYANHGKHEQVNSEFKIDLDLLQMPSGEFGSNDLGCQPAALAKAILRQIGQRGFWLGSDAPVRHQAKRWRLKTVKQQLTYGASPLIQAGRRVILGLGANDRAAKAFGRLHADLLASA